MGGGSLLRSILGAMLGAGAVLAGLMYPVPLLRSQFGNLLVMSIICLIAYVFAPGWLKKSFLFILLRFSVEGAAGENSIWWTVILCGGCWLLYKSGGQKDRYIPMVLCYGENKIKLTALMDTGLKLLDPVTGKPVTVLGADVAEKLTGLTQKQLADPVHTVGTIPGLRLIPYKTVGQSSGLLLGLQIRSGNQGEKRVLVALAPNILDEKGKFQALTGGVL